MTDLTLNCVASKKAAKMNKKKDFSTMNCPKTKIINLIFTEKFKL